MNRQFAQVTAESAYRRTPLPSLRRRATSAPRNVLCALILSLFSTATCQTGFVGGSVGLTFVGPVPTPPANVHAGFSVAPRIDFRADLTYYLAGGILQLSPNVLADVRGDGIWYAGGGPRMVRVGGFTGFGLGVLGGREFPMANDFTWFLEGGLDLLVTVIPLSFVKFAVGMNYHF